MKSFSANNKDWIIVDVPKKSPDAFSYSITLGRVIMHNDDGFGHVHKELPNGNYKIIGLTSELTEAQCADVVDKDSIGDLILYKNYLAKELSNVFNTVDTAKESFMSLMRSLNIENGLLIEKI